VATKTNSSDGEELSRMSIASSHRSRKTDVGFCGVWRSRRRDRNLHGGEIGILDGFLVSGFRFGFVVVLICCLYVYAGGEED
jgi:hypothetical protein